MNTSVNNWINIYPVKTVWHGDKRKRCKHRELMRIWAPTLTGKHSCPVSVLDSVWDQCWTTSWSLHSYCTVCIVFSSWSSDETSMFTQTYRCDCCTSCPRLNWCYIRPIQLTFIHVDSMRRINIECLNKVLIWRIFFILVFAAVLYLMSSAAKLKQIPCLSMCILVDVPVSV